MSRLVIISEIKSFVSQNLSPQNGGFIRAIFARPNLTSKNYAAARSDC